MVQGDLQYKMHALTQAKMLDLSMHVFDLRLLFNHKYKIVILNLMHTNAAQALVILKLQHMFL